MGTNHHLADEMKNDDISNDDIEKFFMPKSEEIVCLLKWNFPKKEAANKDYLRSKMEHDGIFSQDAIEKFLDSNWKPAQKTLAPSPSPPFSDDDWESDDE